jgi:endonuclease/exonuclease/phosphatase family metal-dependent hydrolase
LVLLLAALAGPACAQTTQRFYFVGHSYFNAGAPIPTVFSNLATAAGRSVLVDRRVVGGSTLSQHWAEAVAPAAISNGTYDFVVLVDGSRTAFTAPPANNPANFTNYSARFDDVVTNRGGRSVLFAHWAGAASILQEGLSTSQTNINAMYFDQSARLGCLAAPVGSAWRRALEQDAVLKALSVDEQDAAGLYLEGDTSHGGIRGSYLSACAVYASVYDESPEGIASYFLDANAPQTDVTLMTNEAGFFQRVAWDAWRRRLATNPPTVSVTASTNRVGVGGSVVFSCNATDDGSIAGYAWQFGDGSTSNGATLSTVTQTFTQAGFFDAFVTVTDDEGEIERAGQVIRVDGAPPQVTGADATNALSVRVFFDEAVGLPSAEVATNYSLGGVPSVTGVVRAVDGQSVTLHLGADLVDGQGYTVTVWHAEDLYGNAGVPGPAASFVFVDTATNTYTEWWFDFGGADHPMPAPWNNVTDAGAGAYVVNALDTNGVATSMDIAIEDAFVGAQEAYPTNALYPADAGRDSLYVYGGHIPAADTQGVIRISGLLTDRAYDLTLFASGATLYHTTHFKAGGTEQVVMGGYNQSAQAVLTGIAPDINGTITLQVWGDTYSDYANLNVMKIRAAEWPEQFLPPFTETFEAGGGMAGTPGPLDGQNGWTVGGSRTALVQSAVSRGGAQACLLTNGTVRHAFDDRNTSIWVRLHLQGVASDTPSAIPSGASAVFWVNSGHYVTAYSSGVQVTLSAQVEEGAWVDYLAQVDYAAQRWGLWVNGTNVAESLGFHAAGATAFSNLTVAQDLGVAYLDDVGVWPTNPAAGGEAGIVHTVTVASAHGTPVPGVGEQVVTQGEWAVFSSGLSPLEAGGTQYLCEGWTLVGHEPASGSGTNVAFAVTNSAALTWLWSTQVSFAAVAGMGGSVSGSSNGWYALESGVSVTAAPSSGWVFAGWTGDVSAGYELDNPLGLTLDHARAVTATFLPEGGPGSFTAFAWNTFTGGSQALATNRRAAIVSMGADIMLLMECGTTNGITNLVAELSAAYGEPYYFAYKRPETANTTYPLALVSRHPIQGFQVFGAVTNNGFEDGIETRDTAITKVMLKADVVIGGGTVTVFGVHANTASSVTTHRNEATALLASVQSLAPGGRAIVLGDFNSRSRMDGAVHSTSDSTYSTEDFEYPNTFSTDHFSSNAFVDAWRLVHPAPEALEASKLPKSDQTGSNKKDRIDHLMVSADMADRVLDAGVLRAFGNTLSDHRPVWVQIRTDGGATPHAVPVADPSLRIAATVLGPSNTHLDVWFSESVYAATNAAGAVGPEHFDLRFEQHDGNGGTATQSVITSATRLDGAALQGGEEAVRLHLMVQGTPSGAETIWVRLAATNPVYDADGETALYNLTYAGAPYADTAVRGNYHSLSAVGTPWPRPVIAPAHGASGVSSDVVITVTFEQPMQWLGGQALATGAAARALATLRVGGPAGDLVPFALGVAGGGQTITLTPVDPLPAGQSFYVAVAGSALKDASGRQGVDEAAVFTTASTVFFPLWTSASGAGVVNPAGSNDYAAGSLVYITATADPYYEFAGWAGSASGLTNPAAVVMDAARTVTAHFVETLLTNGVPAWWLAGHGLPQTDEGALDDDDEDGLRAWEEYIAGTLPTQASSTVRCELRGLSPGPVIGWSPVTGRVYSIWWSSNLLAGFDAVPVATGLTAGSPSYTDTVHGAAAGAYRMGVERE